MRSGVRWAETMRVSWATPSASSISAAACMVAQSDWLPMMMPTEWMLCFEFAMRLGRSFQRSGAV